MKTGVLVLAAGEGRRFGSDKRLAVVDGQHSLLRASLEPVLQSGLALRVCLRPGDEALLQDLRGQGIPSEICDRAALGMGATLAQGVAALPEDWEGVMIALGDMPWIDPGSFQRVAQALENHRIVQPRCEGQSGHPVGFRRSLFPELIALSGDRGARSVLGRHAGDVFRLDLEDAGILRDVDTPGDL